MTLANIGGALRMVLDELAQARRGLASGITSATSARDQIASIAQGGQRPTLDHAVAELTSGTRVMGQADALIASAMADIAEYARRIGFALSPPAHTAVVPQQAAASAEPRAPAIDVHIANESAVVSQPTWSGLDAVLAAPDQIPGWVREAASKLPERPGGVGPTHGTLHGVDGQPLAKSPLTRTNGDLRSGKVPSARDGLRSDWYPGAQVIREHVESHAAAILRKPGTPQEAVIVINKPTCRTMGKYVGCDEVLPGLLPEGKRLAVYVTDGRETKLLKVYQGTGEGIAP